MLKPDFHTISRSTSPRFYPGSTQTLSQLHAAEFPVLMIHAQPKTLMKQNPKFDDPCSTHTLMQFHAAQAPSSMIHAQPKLSVSCSRIPRFDDPCSTQTLTQQNPKLMIHARPRLSYNFMQHKTQVLSMSYPNSQSVACSRIPSFDDPCSTQTLMQQNPQV